MGRNREADERLARLLNTNTSDRTLQDTYYVMNGILNTLARFNIWNFDIESYTGWRPACKRLAEISRRHHEEMRKASEIQGQRETKARMYDVSVDVFSIKSTKKSTKTNENHYR